ncbi:MAG: hypothetical protein KDB53_07460, partial [Planctomycetes bacterium]|nr:hypothetical protein [Planctomycetota bacterium]
MNDTNHFEIILELDNGSNPGEGGFRIIHPVLDENEPLGQQGMLGHTPGGFASNPIDRELRTK